MQVSASMIEDMVTAIVQEVDPEYVYLFGSQVSGNATYDSDVDLLVVEAETFGQQKKRWQEMQRIRKSLRKFRVAKDILLYSQHEFDEVKKSENHVVGHAVHNGRLMYERH